MLETQQHQNSRNRAPASANTEDTLDVKTPREETGRQTEENLLGRGAYASPKEKM